MNDKNVITISNNQDWSLSYGYGNKKSCTPYANSPTWDQSKQMLVTSNAKQHKAQVKNTHEKYSCYKI